MILEVPEITQEIGHSRAKRPGPAKGTGPDKGYQAGIWGEREKAKSPAEMRSAFCFFSHFLRLLWPRVFEAAEMARDLFS